MNFMRTTDFFMALAAGVIFALSFRVNQIFDAYFVYSAGISLLFIPAGVKLLLLLVGRLPACAGLLVSGVYLGIDIWPDKPMFSIFLFAFIGLTAYALVALGLMKLLRIRHDLANLKYGYIVVFSVVASVLNGVVHNIVYVTQDVILTEDLWIKSLAMTFGDFMGCLVTVGLFHTALLVFKSWKTKQAHE
jgi:hypothetical protein